MWSYFCLYITIFCKKRTLDSPAAAAEELNSSQCLLMRLVKERSLITLPWLKNFCMSASHSLANMSEKMKTLICMTFMCMIALRNKTVVHTFLPSFNNTMAVSIKKDYIWDPEILKSSEESPCQQSLQCIFYVVKFRVVKKDSARVAKERLWIK